MAQGDPVRQAMARAAALFGEGRLDESAQAARGILARDPRHFHALHLLSAIAGRRARWEESARLATEALAAGGPHAEVLCNRGAALRMLHRFDEAIADYDRALALEPRSAVAHHNRGVALAALGRHDAALEAFDRALALKPDHAQARYARGLSRLALGDFAHGWEDHEWRWSGSENATAPRAFPIPPLAAGEPLEPHRLALWTEQGIGDQVLFSSLVPALAARRVAFTLEADPRLLPAIRRAHPAWSVVPAPQPAFEGCDRHLPLGSLPRRLRPTPESFSETLPALFAADPRREAHFRERLGPFAGRTVGLSWRSFQPAGRATFYERRKNAPLAAFLPFAQEPSLRLVDLQYGDTREERDAFAASGGALASFDDLDRYHDLDGLLALIAACDVVVTTSNVTAHLAGALGRRTLLAFPGAMPPFHYWAPDRRNRSRWYPSVEIVTDRDAGDWDALVRRIRAAL